MKALSLIQPWAGLVVNGSKQVETRSFRVNYRGPVFIHASLKTIKPEQLTDEFVEQYKRTRCNMTYCGFKGAIIGAVCLYDVVPTEEIVTYKDIDPARNFTGIFDNRPLQPYIGITKEERIFGDYSHGRYGWLMRDPVKFSKPIPISGALGLWNLDDNYLHALRTEEAREAIYYHWEHKDKYAPLK